MTTFIIGSAPSFVVDIFTGGEQRCHQPYNVDGTPWASVAQARAWALERVQQGITHENWPPLDPDLAPPPEPAPVDPPADPAPSDG